MLGDNKAALKGGVLGRERGNRPCSNYAREGKGGLVYCLDQDTDCISSFIPLHHLIEPVSPSPLPPLPSSLFPVSSLPS
jgi:hypothetical protein